MSYQKDEESSDLVKKLKQWVAKLEREAKQRDLLIKRLTHENRELKNELEHLKYRNR